MLILALVTTFVVGGLGGILVGALYFSSPVEQEDDLGLQLQYDLLKSAYDQLLDQHIEMGEKSIKAIQEANEEYKKLASTHLDTMEDYKEHLIKTAKFRENIVGVN